jgi:hypothetical protein
MKKTIMVLFLVQNVMICSERVSPCSVNFVRKMTDDNPKIEENEFAICSKGDVLIFNKEKEAQHQSLPVPALFVKKATSVLKPAPRTTEKEQINKEVKNSWFISIPLAYRKKPTPRYITSERDLMLDRRDPIVKLVEYPRGWWSREDFLTPRELEGAAEIEEEKRTEERNALLKSFKKKQGKK